MTERGGSPDGFASGRDADPFASGRDADVFALRDGTVLRRYRRGGDVSGEAAVMTYLRDLGYPVPQIHSAAGPDLVMERLAGPTALAALVAGDLSVAECAGLLADLLARLHALPARLANDPSLRVLHLDLHPGNVILSPAGPMVIDWRNTAEGPPDLDVATSALLMAVVALDDNPLAGLAAAALSSFLARAGGDPAHQLARAVQLRAVDPSLTAAERGRLGRAAALVRS